MLTESQQTVLDVLDKYGPLPDHALVPLVQHVAQGRMSSSGVRTRRNELVTLNKVKATGDEIKMPSGRMATVWDSV